MGFILSEKDLILFEKGFILIKNGLNFVREGLKFCPKLSSFCPRITEHYVQYLLKKVPQSLAMLVFMNCFQKFVHLSDFRTNLGAFCPSFVRNFVREWFFRTKLGQKFVKYAQETLECQMNISSWFSDKWIFWWVIFLCVYAFLIFERG